MEKSPTRMAIIVAVITCIEKYGIDKVTIRKIAVEAGTNIASINYYFRSKEKLFEEVLSMTIKHMVEDVVVIINNEDSNFEKMLEEVFFYMMEGSMRYPGITTAHFYSAVIDKDYSKPGGVGLRNIFKLLLERTLTEYPNNKAEDVQILLSQLFNATMFFMLTPGLFPISENYQATNKKYIRLIAKKYTDLFFAGIQ